MPELHRSHDRLPSLQHRTEVALHRGGSPSAHVSYVMGVIGRRAPCNCARVCGSRLPTPGAVGDGASADTSSATTMSRRSFSHRAMAIPSSCHDAQGAGAGAALPCRPYDEPGAARGRMQAPRWTPPYDDESPPWSGGTVQRGDERPLQDCAGEMRGPVDPHSRPCHSAASRSAVMDSDCAQKCAQKNPPTTVPHPCLVSPKDRCLSASRAPRPARRVSSV